ncbi:diacylglycerol/lipid kinase family protein [Demequina aurantiaca]|uniref:diacylglycerol/lipid kinase family protein n=1 Tax=Demequina aurantiaca TaxID=676200 RepID=UPI003D34CE93
MIAIILGSLGLLLGLIALVMSIATTRHLGKRDPSAVPPRVRKLLGIKSRPTHHLEQSGTPSAGRERLAFVANPTKNGISELRELSMRACSARYMPEPRWYFTTKEDPGEGQARQAIADGADVVVAVGGDGTVRAVAAAVAGTETSLGILPMGTGNLFARNANLPLTDAPAQMRTVIEGDEVAIDVVWLDVEREHNSAAPPERHICLVIAGAGFDAEMVAGTDDKLKHRIGWFAYFLAAIKFTADARMEASVSVDNSKPVSSQMRTVMIANVGSLPGGLKLIPDASVTDGLLDVATLDARAGVVGWTDLFGTVVAQGAGVKQPEVLKAYRTSRIDLARGKCVEIQMKVAQKIQVDGESLGTATGLRAEVAHGALKLRVRKGDKAFTIPPEADTDANANLEVDLDLELGIEATPATTSADEPAK